MKEHTDKIGKYATIAVDGLRVVVKVLDVKMGWGQVRWQISPVVGSGAIWVERIEHLAPEYEPSL